MAHYEYKRVRDILIAKGWLDKNGDPADKEKYGAHIDSTDDGNLWNITADYIESLNAKLIEWSVTKNLKMYNPPHPGETLEDMLFSEPKYPSIRSVARSLGVAPSTFNRLLKGDSSVSVEMAIKPEKVFGVSARAWLNMQNNYDIFKIESLQE